MGLEWLRVWHEWLNMSFFRMLVGEARVGNRIIMGTAILVGSAKHVVMMPKGPTRANVGPARFVI